MASEKGSYSIGEIRTPREVSKDIAEKGMVSKGESEA